MGELKDVNRDDLLNRFANHSFTEIAVGDQTRVDFKDGSSNLIGSAQSKVVDIAYQRIRQELVGGGSILLGDFTFQGSTKFGGDTSIIPNGAIDVVGVNAATTRIRTFRFQNSFNGAAIQMGLSRGSEGSLSAVLSADRLGQILFLGDDGVEQTGSGPVIRCFTVEDWSGSAKGSKITVETVKPGATDETLAMTFSEHGYPETPTYTVATLPNVGSGGGMILVSDETGGATLAFSDGINWRRVQDRAIVA
jgi:hypothetical protein